MDGADSGAKRRIRKADYISRFVDADQVDESQHMYKRDPEIIQAFKDNHVLQMEFVRVLLDAFDYEYEFQMPEVVKNSSLCYLEENDAVFKFTQDHIVPASDSHFTLTEVKEVYKRSEHYNGKMATLKNDLIKTLGTQCHAQLRIGANRYRNVFLGFRLEEISNDNNNMDF